MIYLWLRCSLFACYVYLLACFIIPTKMFGKDVKTCLLLSHLLREDGPFGVSDEASSADE